MQIPLLWCHNSRAIQSSHVYQHQHFFTDSLSRKWKDVYFFMLGLFIGDSSGNKKNWHFFSAYPLGSAVRMFTRCIYGCDPKAVNEHFFCTIVLSTNRNLSSACKPILAVKHIFINSSEDACGGQSCAHMPRATRGLPSRRTVCIWCTSWALQLWCLEIGSRNRTGNLPIPIPVLHSPLFRKLSSKSGL